MQGAISSSSIFPETVRTAEVDPMVKTVNPQIQVKSWRKLRGFKELQAVVKGIGFKDGIRVKEDKDQEAA